MSQIQQRNHSWWQQNSYGASATDGKAWQPLKENLQTEVCVVGAGVAGLTIAYQLLEKGFSVVVLDKESLGNNETGYSTAHLSTALDEGYAQLLKWHGPDKTRLAFESHAEAIRWIERAVTDLQIDCDFERVDGYLFAGPENTIDELNEEQAAAVKAGVLDAQVVARVNGAPFEVGPALHYSNQAQLNPYKYLQGLARAVTALGGKIYGQTKVTEVSGDPVTFVTTAENYRVNCEHVVVATNVPVNDLVTMHTKESAYRSYAIAIRIPKVQKFAQYWDMADPYHYVRFQKENDQYDIAIVGGEDHRVGQEEHPEKCFERLEEWAYLRMGLNGEVVARWSGQIIEPIDGLAYIGRNPGDKDNVYIVSADSGHGMTHGTIAGMLISDMIAGMENDWEDLYDPRRFNWRCLSDFARENLKGAITMADWVRPGDKVDRDELQPGEGAVFTDGALKTAVYRDEQGQLHEFSASCPHLKAVVHWNSSEKTWDCPFHGSRFNKMGEVLNGPAISDLTPKPIAPLTPAPELAASFSRE